MLDLQGQQDSWVLLEHSSSMHHTKQGFVQIRILRFWGENLENHGLSYLDYLVYILEYLYQDQKIRI